MKLPRIAAIVAIVEKNVAMEIPWNPNGDLWPFFANSEKFQQMALAIYLYRHLSILSVYLLATKTIDLFLLSVVVFPLHIA